MMKSTNSWIRTPLVLLITAVTFSLVGANAFGPSSPTTVATVDLEAVLNNLTARADADAQLARRGESLVSEENGRLEKLKAMEDALKNTLTPGTPAYQQAEEEYQKAAVEYRVWRELEMQKLDRDKGLIFQKLYRDIKSAAAGIADRNGYDIVLVNDSIRPLQPGGETAIGQQISMRRVLYADKEVDITGDLIDTMNAAYNANQ